MIEGMEGIQLEYEPTEADVQDMARLCGAGPKMTEAIRWALNHAYCGGLMDGHKVVMDTFAKIDRRTRDETAEDLRPAVGVDGGAAAGAGR